MLGIEPEPLRQDFGEKSLVYTGAFVLFFAIITLGIDAEVYTQLRREQVGMWWAAAIAICGVSMIFRDPMRCTVTISCVVSSVAVLLCLIGSTTDSAAYSAAKSLAMCVGRPDNATADTISQYASKTYGNEAHFNDARDCYLTAHYNSYSNLYNCYCSDSAGQCFFYDGPSDCSKLYGVYKTSLGAATAFDVITLISVFVFAVFSCCYLCCPQCLGGDAHYHQNDLGTVTGTGYIVEVPAQATIGVPPHVVLGDDGQPSPGVNMYGQPIYGQQYGGGQQYGYITSPYGQHYYPGPVHMTTAVIAGPPPSSSSSSAAQDVTTGTITQAQGVPAVGAGAGGAHDIDGIVMVEAKPVTMPGGFYGPR